MYNFRLKFNLKKEIYILVKLSMIKKGDLPNKIYLTCLKPFNWRKKWKKNWEEVKYCSEKCRRNKPK